MGSAEYTRMSKSNQSIQRLLKAESEATAKIQAARANKANLLKKARDDAELEVRAKKETEFNDYKRSYEQDTGSYEQQLQKETQKTIQEIQQQVATNKSKVVELILKTIADVHIE